MAAPSKVSEQLASSTTTGAKIALDVAIVDAAGNQITTFGGAGTADDADFTAGTTTGTPAMGVYEPVPTSVTADDLGIIGITQSREVKVAVTSGGTAGIQYTEGDTDASITGIVAMWEDAGDTIRAVSAAKPLPISDAGGSLTVDNGGTFAVQITSLVPGTSGTNLGKAEDVAHVDGDVGVMALAVRDDTLNIRSGAENDYEPLHTDANGALWTHPTDTIAHDDPDAGNGVKVALKAESSPKGITLVADADRTNAYADIDGLQMVKVNTSFGDIVSERVSNTNGTSTDFSNFTAVASTKNYVTAITVFRTDSGSTPAYVDFRSGSAGAILWSMPLPPNGGSTVSSTTPLFATAANTALAYDVSAALTTVYISVSGFQSKV